MSDQTPLSSPKLGSLWKWAAALGSIYLASAPLEVAAQAFHEPIRAQAPPRDAEFAELFASWKALDEGDVAAAGRRAAQEAYVPPTPYVYSAPIPRVGCAENGSCYGEISEATGRPKTVYVGGYYRRDGTYVRGHYRSRRR